MKPQRESSPIVNEDLIQLEGVSKRFKLYSSASHRLKDVLLRRNSHREHWALRNINLRIARGESVGLVGANGAGKSTLLRIIASVTIATSGVMRRNGRVAALLELGSGFHPEWTGRQNALFQLRLMRIPRHRLETVLKEISDFADIGDYFDQPVRTYSSGMFLRVAFATAVCIEPDILIIDEALSVGDAQFQHKSFQRIRDLKQRGVTILFVTHRLELIPQLCARALLLRQGELIFDGSPGEAINRYAELMFRDRPERTQDTIATELDTDPLDQPGSRIGSGQARIVETAILNQDGNASDTFRSGDIASFIVRARFESEVEPPWFTFAIKTIEDVCVYGMQSQLAQARSGTRKAGDIITVRIDCPLRLPSGTYFIDFWIAVLDPSGSRSILDRRIPTDRITVLGPSNFFGLADMSAAIHEITHQIASTDGGDVEIFTNAHKDHNPA